MSRFTCTRYETPDLLAYWLGELDPAEEARFEEHLFACDACTEHLRTIVQLSEGARQELVNGNVSSVLVAPFVQRLKDAGLRIREYNMAPGGSVNCTVTPDDDLALAHLQAPLRDLQRLDVLIYDEGTGERWRQKDIPFNAGTNALVYLPSTTMLRSLGVTTQRFQLVAVDGVDERVIADYTFNHSPS